LWQFYIGLIKLKDFKLEPVTVFTEASKVDILRGVLLLLLGQAERKLGRLNQQW